MQSTEVRREPSARCAISSLSRAGQNPYLDLLYESLATVGIPTGDQATLRLRWLLAHRQDVRYLHVHWPEGFYRFQRGPSRLRPFVSWIKLARLGVRLRIARALGYRIIWTIHQVYPHDAAGQLDRASARMVARHADLLLAHDPETATRARLELAPITKPIEVVGHGSYVGVYPPGRSREEVRRAFGITEDAVVFLRFGELRANSDVSILLDAFTGAEVGESTLVVAGSAKDRLAGAAIAAAATADNRIVRIDGFVPFERVRELYDAADVAVVTRGDGGTSGSLILALSLGKPVVAPDMPAYRRLVGDAAAGWLFRSEDSDDLRATLEVAAADGADRAERASAASRVAATLDWNEAAERFAALLPEVGVEAHS